MRASLLLVFFPIVIFFAITSMLLEVWQWWNGLKFQSLNLNHRKVLYEDKKWRPGNWLFYFSSWIFLKKYIEEGEAELWLWRNASRLGSSLVYHMSLWRKFATKEYHWFINLNDDFNEFSWNSTENPFPTLCLQARWADVIRHIFFGRYFGQKFQSRVVDYSNPY